MKLIPDQWAALNTLSDEDLGKRFLALHVVTQAGDLGIPPEKLSRSFVNQVLRHIPTLEAGRADTAALQVALHKAAAGEFETAGRFLRQHMVSGAHAGYANQKLARSTAVLKQKSEFGKKGARTNQEIGSKNRRRVEGAARELMAKRTRRTSQRQLAELIAGQLAMNFNTVLGHLKALKIPG